MNPSASIEAMSLVRIQSGLTVAIRASSRPCSPVGTCTPVSGSMMRTSVSGSTRPELARLAAPNSR